MPTTPFISLFIFKLYFLQGRTPHGLQLQYKKLKRQWFPCQPHLFSLDSCKDVHSMVYKEITDRKSMLPMQTQIVRYGMNW
jgi:hypothetical protein